MNNFKIKYNRLKEGNKIGDSNIVYCVKSDVCAEELIQKINNSTSFIDDKRRIEVLSVKTFNDSDELEKNNINGHLVFTVKK